MTNTMKNGVRRVGDKYQVSVNLGKRPAQRCRDCNARYPLERRPLRSCTKCGGELYETMEKRQQYIGTFDLYKQAKAAHDAATVRVAQGNYADPGKLTVGEYMRDWAKGLSDDGLQPATVASYEMHIERHIVPKLGGMKLRDLTGQRLREHYVYLGREGKMTGEGLGDASVRKVRAVMHAALADAVGDHLLPYNPADSMGRRARRTGEREQQEGVRAWSREQLRTFLDSVRDDRLHPLWYVLSATGTRRGEALGLKWDSLDLDEGYLNVQRTRVPVRGEVLEGQPKTDTSRRRIRLGASTVAVLRLWKKQQTEERLHAGSAWHDTGYVFTYEDGRPLDPRWVSRLFTRAIAKVNAEERAKAEAETPAEPDAEPRPDALPPLSIHGLRHTYATAALSAKVPVKAVSANLGHANIQITLDTYSHVLDDLRDEAAETVHDYIFAERL